MKSIRDFGVLPGNEPELNSTNLQEAIDWAALRGAALYVDPDEEPYRLTGGIVVKMNASLIGAHGPVGRGTKHPTKAQPVGSVIANRAPPSAGKSALMVPPCSSTISRLMNRPRPMPAAFSAATPA